MSYNTELVRNCSFTFDGRCPKCKRAATLFTKDSRQTDNGLRRRRIECGACGHRFNTYEIYEDDLAELILALNPDLAEKPDFSSTITQLNAINAQLAGVITGLKEKLT